jgi:hypothetical protein
MIRESRRSQRLQDFRGNKDVKGKAATRRAKRALDILIASEKRVAVAIDGEEATEVYKS